MSPGGPWCPQHLGCCVARESSGPALAQHEQREGGQSAQEGREGPVSGSLSLYLPVALGGLWKWLKSQRPAWLIKSW